MKSGQPRDLQEKEIRKRVLTRLAASPLVLGPIMLGFSAMVAGWALDVKQMALCLFGGIAGLMMGMGTFLTQWMIGGQKVAQEVISEWQLEQSEKKIKDLDLLESILIEADEDPRPEETLKDLRALVNTFETLEDHKDGNAWPMVMEVRMQVESLFSHCVGLIRQTHSLWETASQLTTNDAKAPILAQRESLIDEVQGCVSQLSQTMVSLQNMNQVEATTDRLKQLRTELDQSLAVAQKVEERMRQWPGNNENQMQH